MRIRPCRLVVTLLFPLVLIGCRGPEPDPEPSADGARRPNILLIVADDMGYTDIGAFGAEISTPNLDALAMDGVRFTNFHAAPSCGPTRAMLISGVTNREAGVAGPDAALSDNVAPLPALMREAGYRTYMAGKWHLGSRPGQSPAARGFDRSYALVHAGDNHLGPSNFPADTVAYREDGEPVDLPDGWFSTELYTDKLIEYLRAGNDGGDEAPWFGYLALTAPHWPLQVPDDWIDRYAGAYDAGYDAVRGERVARARELDLLPDTLSLDGYTPRAPAWDALSDEARQIDLRSMELYAAMVENMDFHIGRLIDYLEASGQFDDTVILFFSDNGASGSDASFQPRTIPRTDWDSSLPNMGRPGSFVAIGRGWAEAATAPYREVKGSLHEGGTLAAAFMRHASIPGAERVDPAYLTVMDVMPTLLEIAETSHPGTEFQGRAVLPIRGRSFWGRARGDGAPVHDAQDAIPWMTSPQRAALVRGPWKLLRDPGAAGGDTPPWRLYHLGEDPGETTDRSAAEPELTAELIALWEEYRAGL